MPRKPLRPVTIAVAGPSTLGLAASIAVFLSPPEPHRWSELLVVFGMGAAMGITVFVPIGAAIAFRTRLAYWLERYGACLEWYMSISMAVSLGYIAASIHQKSVDAITVVALLLVFLCALTKTALGIAFRDRGKPPSEPMEMTWMALSLDSVCRCDTVERVLTKARGRVPWLQESNGGLLA